MTGWHLGEMAAFDIESGGVCVETDGVVTVTVATVGGDREPDLWTGLIAVDFDIAPEATAVHGIETAHAREHGKPAADVLDEATGRLYAALSSGTPIVAMNVSFDLTILDRNCRRYGVPTLTDRLGGAPIAPVIDVLVIDKAVDRYRPGKRRLENLAQHYGARHGGAHDALEDALAAARVAYRIGQRCQMSPGQIRAAYAERRRPNEFVKAFADLGAMSLAELHDAQVRWYAEQAEGLAAYWRKEAAEQLHAADLAVEEYGPADEGAKTVRAEAEELLARADSVNTVWPLQPLREVS